MLHDLGEILQKNMGGSLGALMCIFLEASTAAIHSHVDGLQFWLSAIKLGIGAVQKYGLAELGDRTMLDALQCGVDRLESKIRDNASVIEAVGAFVAGCEQGANNTKDMLPRSGRACYSFSEGKTFKAEVNDPGTRNDFALLFKRRSICLPLFTHYRSPSYRNNFQSNL